MPAQPGFALAGAVMMALLAALSLAWHFTDLREQRDIAQSQRAGLIATSIAAQLSGALNSGVTLAELPDLSSFIAQRRVSDRVASVQLFDVQGRSLALSIQPSASGTGGARASAALRYQDRPVTRRASVQQTGANTHANGMADGRASAGSNADLPFSGPVSAWVRVGVADNDFPLLLAGPAALLLLTIATTIALAAEALRYAWACGPQRRQRAILRGAACLISEDYRVTWRSGQRPDWDLRVQCTAHAVQIVNETGQQLHRLVHSLLRTEPDGERRTALLAIRDKGLAQARFSAPDDAANAASHRMVLAVHAESRWWLLLLGTVVGGYLQMSGSSLRGNGAGLLLPQDFIVWSACLPGLALGLRLPAAGQISPAAVMFGAALCLLSLLFFAGLPAVHQGGAALTVAGHFLAGQALGAAAAAADSALRLGSRRQWFDMVRTDVWQGWPGLLIGLLWVGPVLSLLVVALMSATASLVMLALMAAWVAGSVLPKLNSGKDQHAPRLHAWRNVPRRAARRQTRWLVRGNGRPDGQHMGRLCVALGLLWSAWCWTLASPVPADGQMHGVAFLSGRAAGFPASGVWAGVWLGLGALPGSGPRRSGLWPGIVCVASIVCIGLVSIVEAGGLACGMAAGGVSAESFRCLFRALPAGWLWDSIYALLLTLVSAGVMHRLRDSVVSPARLIMPASLCAVAVGGGLCALSIVAADTGFSPVILSLRAVPVLLCALAGLFVLWAPPPGRRR